MLTRVIIKCIFSFYILICIPLFSHAAEVPAINHPGARVILREEMIPINNRFPTLSSIRLGLGDYIDLLDAEYLLGKAVNSSGPIHIGRTRIEEITFTYGTIITVDNQITLIRVYPKLVDEKDQSPLIAYGFKGMGYTEAEIRNSCGNPSKITQDNPTVKTLIYTNGVNYILLDINRDTDRVISYEIGLEHTK